MEFVGDLAASAASLTISFHPAWWVRRHSGCLRLRMPVLWWQKGQVLVADFRGLERGICCLAFVGSLVLQALHKEVFLLPIYCATSFFSMIDSPSFGLRLSPSYQFAATESLGLFSQL